MGRRDVAGADVTLDGVGEGVLGVTAAAGDGVTVPLRLGPTGAADSVIRPAPPTPGPAPVTAGEGFAPGSSESRAA
ncbi:hypothetical protein [Actinomadura spongiicola]|uniref:hypothetical protein n=1 Tax=Actinomadura spongiicola TaxID=2303421 RepID=UPI001314371D|nr:hypothetical protein [Actinomadura spongiicola]